MEKNREKDRIIAGKDRTIVELNSKIDQMAGLSRQQQNIARRRQTARHCLVTHCIPAPYNEETAAQTRTKAQRWRSQFSHTF